MTESVEERVIQRFRESVAQDSFPEGVTVTYRIVGGIPSERTEQEVVVQGNRQAVARSVNMLTTAMPREASEELSSDETRELFNQVSSDIEGLVTRENARFVPDSLVGTITIDMDGEEATFYFSVEDEDVEERARALPTEHQALKHFDALSKRLLEKDEVDDE